MEHLAAVIEADQELRRRALLKRSFGGEGWRGRRLVQGVRLRVHAWSQAPTASIRCPPSAREDAFLLGRAKVAGFVAERDGDAVADGEGEAGAADQFVGFAVVGQRRARDRTNQHFEERGSTPGSPASV